MTIRTCDLCKMDQSSVFELKDEYKVHGVEECCRACKDEIESAYDKVTRISDKLKISVVRRVISAIMKRYAK